MRLQIFIPLQATRAAHFSDQHLQSNAGNNYPACFPPKLLELQYQYYL